MNEALGSYLHDHLGGATFAVELLESLRDQHAKEPLGKFASNLLIEIEEDRQTLKSLIEKVNTHTAGLKAAAGWFAEKASRLKLSRDGHGPLGVFESLEALALGILGKESLWRALAQSREAHESLRELDLQALIARARNQYQQMEERRLEWAPAALVHR